MKNTFNVVFLFQEIPQSLWYLSFALIKRQRYIMQLIKEEVQAEKRGGFRKTGGKQLVIIE